MARRVGAHEWHLTPLGPVAAWPQALRTAVEIVLDSKFPSILAWGADLTVCAYNDAYRLLLGEKPEALGRPLLEVWSEARAIIAPQIKRTLEGEGCKLTDAEFTLMRHGILEQAWFEYSFSPVRDASGAVAGVLNIALETKARRLAKTTAERDLALAEAFHRVNNNLQTISTLLLMERRRYDDPHMRGSFDRMERRVYTMGLVHQHLMTGGAHGDIDIKPLMAAIVEGILNAETSGSQELSVSLEVGPLRAMIDIAMPLGLLANELICEAAESARTSGAPPSIAVSLRQTARRWRLEVAGGPESAGNDGGPRTSVVERLSTQLGGHLTFSRTNGRHALEFSAPGGDEP